MTPSPAVRAGTPGARDAPVFAPPLTQGRREIIDGTSRMRRTMFVAQVEATHQRLDAAIARARPLVDHFAMRSPPTARAMMSRAKALAKLKAAFAGCASFMFSTTHKPPLACWGYLRHRDAEDWAAHDAHERDRQRCIVINFLLAGKLPNGQTLVSGRWSLEVTYHTLGRLFSPQRSPLALTPAQTIWVAHALLLKSSVSFLHTHPSVLLPVGTDGGLVLEAQQVEVDGQPHMFVVARSWLPEHMKSSYIPTLPLASELSDAIGAFWLCPQPLRTFRPDGLVDIPDALAEALFR
jgi:hypothetical protein